MFLRRIFDMRFIKYLLLLSVLAVFTIFAYARDKNQRSVNFPDSVKVGSTQLKPGAYKVEWQGTGPGVEVTSQQNGRTVATAPAPLRTNDQQVIQDDVIYEKTTANTNSLKELDFNHQKEALIFSQSGL